ncbi:dentin sialophosphoprotein-like [Homalodisca vitripennis]|uniref:dentin sialophosphoprotein-like n=1 Tax=Homalodisca vitripennis TaxID=197043 RepID=UPI001EEAA364|nr:dentin sialophosphoprotein-like [Homalodisca vitripennis]
MSADHFHHQVNKQIKSKGKMYDFEDFKDAVKASNSGKVTVKSMEHQDFFTEFNYSSQYKIMHKVPRPYLSENADHPNEDDSGASSLGLYDSDADKEFFPDDESTSDTSSHELFPGNEPGPPDDTDEDRNYDPGQEEEDSSESSLSDAEEQTQNSETPRQGKSSLGEDTNNDDQVQDDDASVMEESAIQDAPSEESHPSSALSQEVSALHHQQPRLPELPYL